MMGVFGKKTKSSMYNGKARMYSTPIDRRELRRWMKRNRDGKTVKELVDAAGEQFGFRPTADLLELAASAIKQR